MSSSPPRPSWHELYQAAILELDHDKIPPLVERARTNLADRVRQLDPQVPDERSELNRALNALRMLALLDKTMTAKAAV